MELFSTEALSFSYPESGQSALSDISLSVSSGEFVLLCGKSGCGKTTLLRLLKPSLRPFGSQTGRVRFQGREISSLSQREDASLIGFVMQSPDAQLVTDKVWHELAFGLECLGESNQTIRTRVAEMAAFFGIEPWFHKATSELSGGQKQLLNLASVMVMQPKILLLDEPTSQLDPIAAGEFFNTLERVNRELGTTVILSEHRLEGAFPMADRVVVLSEGKLLADGTPRHVGRLLQTSGDDMARALPTALRVSTLLDPTADVPLSVREGRIFLEAFKKTHSVSPLPDEETPPSKESVIEVRDVWFRYEKTLPDVLKGGNLTIGKGELFALLGGNGAGKTTLLSLLCGIHTPYRGHITIKDGASTAMLTQNPEVLFCQSTIRRDLELRLKAPLTAQDESRLVQTARLCRIDHLLDRHPYDLSGGELQRAALAKVLLGRPDILLLDEPTKGLDAHFKELFADILSELTSLGTTVFMVSHDIEFCAEYADRAALFFDGAVASLGTARSLFSGNSFYTTAAGRMAKGMIPSAVLPRDITEAFGVPYPKRSHHTLPELEKMMAPGALPQDAPKPSSLRKILYILCSVLFAGACLGQMFSLFPLDAGIVQLITAALFAGMLLLSSRRFSSSLPRRIGGGLLFVLFIISCLLKAFSHLSIQKNLWQLTDAALLSGAFIAFFGSSSDFKMPAAPPRMHRRSLYPSLLFLLAFVPLTLVFGIRYLGDRKYYFISLLILLETLLPFLFCFESRHPKARELVLISTICALAIAGRTAFFMLPQFKPVVAILIVTGLCFGAETGFLTGAVTGLISNFFFGQGPWTPWQMVGFGLIGGLSGLLFSSGRFRLTRPLLCTYGFVSTLVIYGGLVNLSSALIFQQSFSVSSLLSFYILGLPMDLAHALSTVFFLWFIAEPLSEKLNRIKTHYGLLNER